MLSRLFIVVGLACLGAVCVAAPIACSSSQRRDKNYGTDLGADYQPEAGIFSNADDGGNTDSEAGSDLTVSPDRLPLLDTQAPDAPAQPDAPAWPDAPGDTLVESEADLTP